MITLRKKHRGYDKYNKSDLKWPEEMPYNWKILKLKQLSKIETGNTPPKSDSDNYSENKKYHI